MLVSPVLIGVLVVQQAFGPLRVQALCQVMLVVVLQRCLPANEVRDPNRLNAPGVCSAKNISEGPKLTTRTATRLGPRVVTTDRDRVHAALQ